MLGDISEVVAQERLASGDDEPSASECGEKIDGAAELVESRVWQAVPSAIFGVTEAAREVAPLGDVQIGGLEAGLRCGRSLEVAARSQVLDELVATLGDRVGSDVPARKAAAEPRPFLCETDDPAGCGISHHGNASKGDEHDVSREPHLVPFSRNVILYEHGPILNCIEVLFHNFQLSVSARR